MKLTRIAFFAGLFLVRVYGQGTCVQSPISGAGGATFPAGFIPFSSISYVTAANFAGDHLVVGVPAPGALSLINATIPLPAFTNQMFCDAQVQLAPQQFYPNVYIPTAAELTGNFSAFNGLFVNAANGQPYPNGQIPAGQLANVFAWRIGPAQVASATQGWSRTGSMTRQRAEDAAVLLPNGTVLLIGGSPTSADVYNPATGTFTAVGSPVYDHETDVTATLLNDGHVLVTGGRSAPNAAELYDPISQTFSATGNSVYVHGFVPTATPLNDGRVLVVGGLSTTGNTGSVNSGAETYNPATGAFTTAGPMTFNRGFHTATLLADGRVLIAGGQGPFVLSATPIFDSGEIYDPSSGNFTLVGPMQQPRSTHVAVRLTDGRVLIAGGYGSGSSEQTAELFDPGTSNFIFAGETAAALSDPMGALLPNGQVLIAGGQPDPVAQIATNAAELYNPADGTFASTGNMVAGRFSTPATVLNDGRVLVAGGYPLCCSALASAEIYTPTTQGLVTSQSGLTFQFAQGNTNVASQTVEVLSNTSTIPWTVSTHTYEGSNWLSAGPSSGRSVPGGGLTSLIISANPAGLATEDYYGAVILTPTDGVHPPITIAIVLHIVPLGTAAPPVVTPSGLLFLGTPGATLKPQAFTISNLTSTPLTFNAVASTSPSWFTFTPATATIAAAQTTSITVTATLGSMTAGVYPASIKLLFGDGSSQTVALLLVISATAGSARPATISNVSIPYTVIPSEARDLGPVRASSPRIIPSPYPVISSNDTPEAFVVTTKATAACTASKLLPVFTTIGTGFNTPAAWPTPIVVQVVDDCGDAFNTGSVIVSFSDSDPPIGMLAIGNGNWAGTWVPQNNSAGLTVRADAQQLPLTGSVLVSGQVLSNPTVPVVSKGGIVSNADFASAPALGLLVSIFGSGLADGSLGDTGVPLPPQLGSTSVVLAGVELPLLYVSNTQVNVAIPFTIQTNTSQQLVVLRGNAVSVPVSLAVFASEPSILSASGSGSGQGLIFNAITGTRADTNAPAGTGDYLVIYALGLGAVTPNLAIGNGTPSSPYEYAVAPVTVTIGGIPATVLFAGLTPGYVGLYQVNVMMPGGVTPGSQVPVTVSVAGKSGAGNITIATH